MSQIKSDAAATRTVLPAPFADTTAAPAIATDAEPVYTLVRRGDIDPSEVELPGTQAAEVSVLWESSILHVTHLDGSRSFELATTAGDAKGATRFVVDESMLPAGVASVAVVANDAQGSRFVFLPGARGEVDASGTKRSLEALVAAGDATPSATLPGAFEVAMREGGRYRMRVGGLTITARVVARGRTFAARGRGDRRLLASGAGALALVASLVGAAYMGSSESAALSANSEDDRLNALRDFMARVHETRPEPVRASENQGGAGDAAPAQANRAAGESGQTGRRDVAQRSGRTQLANNHTNVTVGRAAARQLVAQSAIFAAADGFAVGEQGEVNPFDGMASGNDRVNTTGVGGGQGDGNGFDGLGPSGVGVGGGGDGTGVVALDGVQTASGTCEPGRTCIGNANRVGRMGPRENHGPIVRARPPEVLGLDRSVISRVVQRNIGQIAHCHEQGLSQNPNLQGRVVVRFVIDPGGSVVGAGVAESNIGAPSVEQCIVSVVRRLHFSIPMGYTNNIVVNAYPFQLLPPH